MAVMRKRPSLLLLACLVALLAAAPARASQPTAASLLATATGVVDHATGQIVPAPADVTAPMAQTVPQVVGATAESTAANAARPVVSGAGEIVRDLPTPVTRTLDTAAGTVHTGTGVVRGSTGTVGGAVGNGPNVGTQPTTAPEQAAAPAPSLSSSTLATTDAAPHQSSPTPPAPLVAHAVRASVPHTSVVPRATRFDAASGVARAPSSRPPSGPDPGTRHRPLPPHVPDGTPGSSLSATGGGVAFVLVLLGLLLACRPTLTRRLRPPAPILSGARHVLILDRPG